LSRSTDTLSLRAIVTLYFSETGRDLRERKVTLG
jgi:hypothetical protein